MSMPPDPLTELGKAAAGLHEVFTSYLEAGFSRPEALRLVTVILAESIRAANGTPQPPDPG